MSRSPVARATLLVMIALIAAVACSTRMPPSGGASPGAPDAEISAFLNKYFATWSAHDIEAYGRCFDVDATIQILRLAQARSFVERPNRRDGRLKVYSLRDFLESQRKAQAAHPDSREAPTSMRIDREGDVATVFVRWRLESAPSITGGRVVTGTDCFLLAKREGKWLVTALLVRNDP